METKGWALLRVLLNHFHADAKDSVFKVLPKEYVVEIRKQDLQTSSFAPALAKPVEWINRIHYSWLSETIDQLPQEELPYVLSALPETHFWGIKRMKRLKMQRTVLSAVCHSFFLRRLYNKLDAVKVLPPEFLPPSPLRPLLDLNKQELVELIDFLGLHDVAEEIRFIVDKNNLSKLYTIMTLKKQQYLKICLHQKQKLDLPKLGLAAWKGNIQQLEDLIHRRGMFRLGKAIFGQHPDFIWHITHSLDTGRGALLEKYTKGKENARVTTVLMQQVMDLLNFLNKDMHK